MESFYLVSDSIKILSIHEPLMLNMGNRISRIYSVIINILKVIKKLRRFKKEMEFNYLYTVTP